MTIALFISLYSWFMQFILSIPDSAVLLLTFRI